MRDRRRYETGPAVRTDSLVVRPGASEPISGKSLLNRQRTGNFLLSDAEKTRAAPKTPLIS